jgi:hypothetical protein
MDGFKNSTKMQMGHSFSKKESPPAYAAGKRNVFAEGGIVPNLGGGMPGMRMNTPSVRPVMPRPHVMPQGRPAMMKPMGRLAKGGSVGDNHHGDGGGGPYNHDSGPMEGNSLEHSDRPYSKVEQDHPKQARLRPGYKKGGIHIKPSHKGLFTKKMTGSKTGHLTGKDVNKGLHASSGKTRKQANFARMARRHFEPLHKADGGQICDAPTVRQIADQEVGKHVASPRPAGHGIKSKGGLGAFNRTPLCGGGRM